MMNAVEMQCESEEVRSAYVYALKQDPQFNKITLLLDKFFQSTDNLGLLFYNFSYMCKNFP
jgi:hypothetical protein